MMACGPTASWPKSPLACRGRASKASWRRVTCGVTVRWRSCRRSRCGRGCASSSRPLPRSRHSRPRRRSRSSSSTRTTDLIVLDKPAGLVVHPAPGNEDGTLVNALLAHCGDTLPGIGGERRPGIVHRLDKDTSGIMVVAKTEQALAALSAAFAAREHRARLPGAVLGRAGAGRRRLRGGHRPRSARSQAHGRRRARRQGRAHPLPDAGGGGRRGEPAAAAGWRPAAPIRSGCISRRPVIRCWATRSTCAGCRRRRGCCRRSAGGGAGLSAPGAARGDAGVSPPGERSCPALRDAGCRTDLQTLHDRLFGQAGLNGS